MIMAEDYSMDIKIKSLHKETRKSVVCCRSKKNFTPKFIYCYSLPNANPMRWSHLILMGSWYLGRNISLVFIISLLFRLPFDAIWRRTVKYNRIAVWVLYLCIALLLVFFYCLVLSLGLRNKIYVRRVSFAAISIRFNDRLDQFSSYDQVFLAVFLVAVHRQASFSLPCYFSLLSIFRQFFLVRIFAVERLYRHRVHVVFAFVIHMTTQFYK